jgi:hypothetical protein
MRCCLLDISDRKRFFLRVIDADIQVGSRAGGATRMQPVQHYSLHTWDGCQQEQDAIEQGLVFRWEVHEHIRYLFLIFYDIPCETSSSYQIGKAEMIRIGFNDWRQDANKNAHCLFSTLLTINILLGLR